MGEEILEKKGIGERVLSELLKSPKFKASLRLLVNEMDPATARGLVRALLWEDVETFMAVAGGIPKLVNMLAVTVSELGAQLGNFPPPMLGEFIYHLMEDIDGRTLGEAAGNLHLLLDAFRGREENRLLASRLSSEAREGFAAATGGSAEGPGPLAVLAAEAGKAIRENPEFVSGVIRPLIEGLKEASPDIFEPRRGEGGARQGG